MSLGGIYKYSLKLNNNTYNIYMYSKYIESDLLEYYNTVKNSKLKEILIYSLDGGKCIRGFIVKHLIETISGEKSVLWQPVAAIELIHGISLVIDDLPCMDNDMIRRNKPSTFARYSERQAILTSLYGISEAFHLLFKGIKELNLNTNDYIETIEMILNDWNEMIGKNLIIGQMLDLKENIEELINMKIEFNSTNIILFKTCSLFMFAFILGGIFSGKKVNIEDYKMIGYYFGLMFQIMDDSRDVITDIVDVNIVLSKGKTESLSLYLDSKSKLLDLLNKNNIITEELMKMIENIDNMLEL